MEKNQNTSRLNIAAGVFFIIFILTFFLHFAYSRFGTFNISIYIGAAVCAVAMFMKNSGIIFMIGQGVMTIGSLIQLIYSIRIIDVIRDISSPAAYVIVSLILVAAFAVAIVLTLVGMLKNKKSKLWFLPGLLTIVYWIGQGIAGGFIVKTSYYFGGTHTVFRWSAFFVSLVFALPVVFLAIAMFMSMNWAVAEPKAIDGKDAPAGAENGGGVGYIKLTKHALLLVFTFGIWQYIWYYKTTNYLNRDDSVAPRSAVAQLLLCLFIPLYSIFWTFNSAKRIDRISAKNGLHSALAGPSVFLAIFGSFAMPLLIQNNINTVATAESKSAASAE